MGVWGWELPTRSQTCPVTDPHVAQEAEIVSEAALGENEVDGNSSSGACADVAAEPSKDALDAVAWLEAHEGLALVADGDGVDEQGEEAETEDAGASRTPQRAWGSKKPEPEPDLFGEGESFCIVRGG